MIVIPAIDLYNGSVVRLKKGDFDRMTEYNQDPLDEARKFRKAGFERIHIVDLNGAKEGTFENLAEVKKMITDLDLSIQMGGGIRSPEDVELLLEIGVSKFICSSLAVRNPKEWIGLIQSYPDKAILGMDLKEGRIAYAGWSDTADESIEDFLKPMVKKGLQEVLCTDVGRDGTLEGPNIELYKTLKTDFPGLRFIASGGVSGLEDLTKLDQIDMDAVVVGRAYYENRLSLQEMASISG